MGRGCFVLAVLCSDILHFISALKVVGSFVFVGDIVTFQYHRSKAAAPVQMRKSPLRFQRSSTGFREEFLFLKLFGVCLVIIFKVHLNGK